MRQGFLFFSGPVPIHWCKCVVNKEVHLVALTRKNTEAKTRKRIESICEGMTILIINGI